jgi:hypothetical protein
VSHSPPPKLQYVVLAVIAILAAAPTLIVLAHALLPLAIVIAVAAVLLRLVFFHTRRW